MGLGQEIAPRHHVQHCSGFMYRNSLRSAVREGAQRQNLAKSCGESGILFLAWPFQHGGEDESVLMVYLGLMKGYGFKPSKSYLYEGELV